MKAYIHFNNDPSVGMWPHGHEMELPFNAFEDSNDRETCRAIIKDFYTQLDGESNASWVSFSDESQKD